MSNLLRGLTFEKQVSVTLADTTELVKKGIAFHKLSPASAYVYGKAMSALAFFSSALKEEKGEVSLSIRCSGEAGDIGCSGNRALYLRGYIQNTEIAGAPNEETEVAALQEGVFTLVRDDGYNRPFVGTCALPENGGLDCAVEEYFTVSEQLPTRIFTRVELDEKGECLFAGVLALQPLPFAEETAKAWVKGFDGYALLSRMQKEGLSQAEKGLAIDLETRSEREAVYRCNCSREYLLGVLVTLGEGQLREILREEGAIKVHCHYCNRDYAFAEEDVNLLFKK